MYKILFVLILLVCAGCGRHCLSVDGDYKGFDGKIEYCFDTKAAKEAEAPALTDTEGNTFFGISLGELVEISKGLAPQKEGVKAATEEHPLKSIRRALEKQRAEEKKKEVERAALGPLGGAAWPE
jgi:hypothetical protein